MRIPQLHILIALLALTGPANCQISKVLNAASLSGDAVAPGSIISVVGAKLSNNTTSLSDVRNVPYTLSGVSLTVGGFAAALFYVSPTQVNARIDTRVAIGSAAVVLTGPAGTFNATVNVAAAAPGLFSLNGSGVGDGAIIHALTYAISAFSPRTGSGPTFLSLFATGVDVSEKPIVRIAGVPVPVLFAGDVLPAGLQQINVQLLDSLAGAGRVSVEVESRGRRSNTVEIVLLPQRGQGPFSGDDENESRSREIAAVAWVPNSSLVLVCDENDDVVRVADVAQKRIVRTIVLPGGASPVAVAVNQAGTLAVVAERDRAKAAIIELTTNTVTYEVAVGNGPVSAAIHGTTALVVNQADNTVSIFNLQNMLTVSHVPVGRAPHDVAVDANGARAYVTNQDSGSISVIDIATRLVVDTIPLGAAVRPQAIDIVTLGIGLAAAVVTDPGAGPDGKVYLVNLATRQVFPFSLNPDRSGGISSVAVSGTKVYAANQAAGSVTVAPVLVAGGNFTLTPSTIKADMGARALTIDVKDNLLVVANQGSGSLTLIDLATNKVVGSINAVRSQSGDDEDDDRSDREKGANLPVVTALAPASGKAGTTLTLTITGTRLNGATDVIFIDPDSKPARGHTHWFDHDAHGLGPRDTGITAKQISVNAAGTQLTVQIQIAAGHDPDKRVVRVLTHNGESSFIATAANTFTVTR